MTAINVALIIPFAYYYFQKTYSSCSWIKSIDTIRAERQPLIKNQPLWEEVLVYVWRVLHSQPDYDIGELDFCAINLPEMNGTQFCTHHYPSLFVDGLLEWLMVSADFCLIFYSLERLRNLVQSFSRFRPRWFKSSVYVVVVGGFLAVALVQVVQAVVEREIEMKNWVVTLELLEVFDNKAANLTEYKRRMTDLKVGLVRIAMFNKFGFFAEILRAAFSHPNHSPMYSTRPHLYPILRRKHFSAKIRLAATSLSTFSESVRFQQFRLPPSSPPPPVKNVSYNWIHCVLLSRPRASIGVSNCGFLANKEGKLLPVEDFYVSALCFRRFIADLRVGVLFSV